MKPLAGLLKRKFKEIYREIVEDVKTFGRARAYLWRWIFIVLEDATRDRMDIYIPLDNVVSLARDLALPEERAYVLLNAARLYALKLSERKYAASLIRRVLEEAKRLPRVSEAFRLSLSAVETALSSGLTEFEKEARRVLESARKLDVIRRIEAYGRIGLAMAEIDLSKSDAIFAEGLTFLGMCNRVEMPLAKAMMGYYMLVANAPIGRPKELLEESIKSLSNLPKEQRVRELIKSAPYICAANPILCGRVFEDAMDYARSDAKLLALLAQSAEKTALLGELDWADRMLQAIEYHVASEEFSSVERMYLMARLASSWKSIDGRKSKIFVPVVHRTLSKEIENNGLLRSDYVLPAIMWLSDVDLISAFMAFNKALSAARTLREKGEVIIALSRAFPKEIRGIALRTIMEYWRPGDIQWVLDSARIALHVGLSISDSLLMKVLKRLESEGIWNLEEVAEFLADIRKASPLRSEQVLSVVMERLEELEKLERARALYVIASRLERSDRELALALVRDALGIIEEVGFDRDIKLAVEISRLLSKLGMKQTAHYVRRMVMKVAREERKWKRRS